jgi:hypothetical protein
MNERDQFWPGFVLELIVGYWNNEVAYLFDSVMDMLGYFRWQKWVTGSALKLY